MLAHFPKGQEKRVTVLEACASVIPSTQNINV